MMVQESPILESNYIFLVQTNNGRLKDRLSELVSEEEIRLKSVGSSEELYRQQPIGQIITFIVGNDVIDPIQSAQRLHAYNKNAKIVLLSTTEKVQSLKESVKFAPFIGMDVFCLDETNNEELAVRLKQILSDSQQAQKYRSIVEETNTQISNTASSKRSPFNHHFINKLMDVAPIGIAVVGGDGKIFGWNKEASIIFQKNEAQVLGMPMRRFFEQEESQQLLEYLNEKLESNISGIIEPIILERVKSNNKQQVLNITAAPFTYSEGTEKALILSIKDITKRVRAERELQQVNETLENRVKERTASLLSYQEQLRSLASRLSQAEEMVRQQLATELHDNLGQMLAVSKMKVSSLQSYQLSQEAATDIEDIKEGLNEALAYTRDLMSDLKPPPTLDDEDIRASINWLANKMKKHNLQVELEDDEQPKPVTDEIRTLLVQCVRELLFNILKHAGVKEARVRISRLPTMAEVVVEDKGRGFDLVKNSTSSDDGGFGLFNIRERIDLLGGEVNIDTKPGKGTRISLRVPVTKEAQREKEFDRVSGADVQQKEVVEKIKVLLADDHKMMRVGLRKIVNEQEDLTVIAEASDGKEAIELAEKSKPDVVVMDVNMPGMDGIEATQKLLEKFPDIRVIALSFHDHQQVIDSMRQAGATAYLKKNEAFETLTATIRSEANLAKK